MTSRVLFQSPACRHKGKGDNETSCTNEEASHTSAARVSRESPLHDASPSVYDSTTLYIITYATYKVKVLKRGSYQHEKTHTFSLLLGKDSSPRDYRWLQYALPEFFPNFSTI
ncbi:MAG: hypothetical protein F4X82_03285 [Candidatus Spechtbacteria bacterium SB0662_bin_43]|uniref:Uncharacterized protein n=1 Tax=Candidatus Spechtbacteria bacterium SB0662_bin_43 TaxID=2604897 RepID=A0A845DAJ3_9BACT|nr:hypothetical protein [Candidatus Spechtbacteria bacterium SB0662_bin_43]